MEVRRYRPLIKQIAFWSILAWITLVTVLVVLLIWDFVDSGWVERVIWTASTLTGGILLAGATILGFAAAEEDAERRRLADAGGSDPGESRLHRNLTRAREESRP